jgi:hypothetical protein
MRSSQHTVTPDRQLRAPRWLPFLNAYAGIIPGRSLVEIQSVDDNGVYTVTRPTADSIRGIVAITGPAPCPQSGYGMLAFGGPLPVIYNSANTPAVGDVWGAAQNSFQLTKDKSGFKVLGADTTNHIATVREVAASVDFFDDYVQIKETSPGTNYYGASLREVRSDYAAAAELRIQLFLKLATPVVNPRLLFLAASQLVAVSTYVTASSPPGASGTSDASITAPLQCCLLTPALAAGAGNTYGLDVLTWANSNYSGGALFGTAANFAGPFSLAQVIGGASYWVPADSTGYWKGCAGQVDNGIAGKRFAGGDLATLAGKIYTGICLSFGAVTNDADLTATLDAYAVSATFDALTAHGSLLVALDMVPDA